jgi:4-amino-4-deoxy-L-arabinose transferase-like glycosyltransferase
VPSKKKNKRIHPADKAVREVVVEPVEDETPSPETVEIAPASAMPRRDMLILLVLPALLVLPFLNKAYHVDDPLFMWTAQHLVEKPFDFYGFHTNWSHQETFIWEIMQNPPLLSYYLLPFGRIFGWGEPVMHLAMILPTLLAAVGGYLIARRFCQRPLLAALIAILTPGFLVSATQVMSDVPMVALWLWALHLWLRGLERDHLAFSAAGAFLVAVAALTKYFGASLLPLLLVYTLLQDKHLWRHLWTLLIPFVLLLAYEFYTTRMYGRGLLLDAGSYAMQYREVEDVTIYGKNLTVVVFTGGCLASVLFFTPWLWRTPGLILLAVIFVGGYLFNQADSLMQPIMKLNFDDFREGSYIKGQVVPTNLHFIQWALWFTAGVQVLLITGLDLLRNRNAQSLLLALWIGGTFIFCVFLNHMVNARVILPLAVPVAILVVRRLDMLHTTSISKSPRWFAPLIPATALCLILMAADYTLSGTARTAARELLGREHPERVWFSGHSGFQYYMEALGARSIDRTRDIAIKGDSYIIPSNNWFAIALSPDLVTDEIIVTYDTWDWVCTSHPEAYAGFYSDKAGLLPFVFAPVPDEHYLMATVGEITEVRQ